VEFYLVKCYLLKQIRRKQQQERQSWGFWGSRPPDFEQGGSWGRRRVVKYYHAQEECSKVVTFEEK